MSTTAYVRQPTPRVAPDPKPLGGGVVAGLLASLCCGGTLLFGSIGLGAFYGSLGLARYIPQALALGTLTIVGINWLFYQLRPVQHGRQFWLRQQGPPAPAMPARPPARATFSMAECDANGLACVAGVGGLVRGRAGSALSLGYRDPAGRLRIAVANVGEDGIEPGVWYCVNDAGQFVPA